MTPRTSRGRVAGVVTAAATITLVWSLLAPEAVARSQSPWIPTSATRWEVGGGGDDYRTGYNPTEKPPPFINGGNLGTDDADGPWLEWVTKISDLPSGVWLEAGIAVVDGIVYVAGGATNSFLALDASTGLPIWRFSPDPRTDGYTGAYPASNAPVVKNGVVYVTFSNGILYALNAKTGKKLWSYRATEGYRGPPPPGNTTGRCAGGLCVRGTDPFGPVHPGVDYPKIHGATAFCDNKVFFMTLSGWVYGLDARTGRLLWKRYADGPEFPGELVWWEYGIGGVFKTENKSSGFSTRRFEAVPGLACLHGEVQVAGADGHVRFLDPATGKARGEGADVGPEYDRTDSFGGLIGDVDFCQNAGWNCDIAIGLALPPIGPEGKADGDYIVTTLDSRIVRLDWKTHAVAWRRTYNAPLPLELEVGSRSSFLLSLAHGEHGFVAQSVVGGPMALDPDIAGGGRHPILYASDMDGRLYVLDLGKPANAPGCLRPGDGANAPCLLSRVGISPNTDPQTPYTRRGEGGPWDHNEAALAGVVLGGNVVYVATWDNKIHGFDVRNPAAPKKVWEYQFTWDTSFRYPPFGDTYPDPFADIDNKMLSSPALLGGALYLAANDGRVYKFNLQRRVKTVRNLVVLGSGLVPFIPKWKDALGAFDRVWTEADWYKNQVPPAGYRLPKSAGVAGAAALLLGNAVLLWWYLRREELELEVSRR
jgi:outer membrane protein assembly factor BamB